MVAKSGATVLPIYFEGANSRLFQVASHLHPNLRMALLINEFRRRVDSAVGVRIGAPLPQSELDARAKDPRAMMGYLRAQTYALGDSSVCETLGYEFENNHKTAEQLLERRVY
jgi:putative hemolysin